MMSHETVLNEEIPTGTREAKIKALPAHPRLVYRTASMPTLVKPDDFAGCTDCGGSVMLSPNHCLKRAIYYKDLSHDHDWPVSPSRDCGRAQFRPNSSPFSQPALHLPLDTHRHKGKNTHELIVLPAFRQVLPADSATSA
jgi:hypothetical protein